MFILISRLAKHSDTISLRTFVKGLALFKQCNGQGWEHRLTQEMNVNPKLQIIDRLLSSYETDKERIDVWNSHGWSRRSYYEWKRKMMQKCSVNQDMRILEVSA